MKKRIAFSIALLMILCLALAGCAQWDNHAGATSNEPASESHDGGIGNPDNLESGELDSDVEPIGDDDGSYTYNVSGTDFTCKHNIDDYIIEEDGELVFKLTWLARAVDWKYAGSPDTSLDKQKMFVPADVESWYDSLRVQVEDNSGPYDTIFYVFSTDNVHQHDNSVFFVRSDLMSRDGESVQTYYLNTAINGKTISRDMAVILCYLMENISSDNTDPLEAIYHSTGPYNV